MFWGCFFLLLTSLGLAITGFLTIIGEGANSDAIGYLILSAIGFSALYYLIQKQENEARLRKKKEAEEQSRLEHKLKTIRDSMEKLIPVNAESVRKGEYLMWCTEQFLCWFPCHISVGEENFKLIQIPKDQIYFYVESGDVNTIISGSGGHSSYSFLTGFHGKVNPIEISTTIQDTRCIQLYYMENGIDCRFDLAFEDLNYLRRILPGKDYETVARSESSTQSASTEKTTVEKMKELSNMLANGLISQQEYDDARRTLINKLIQ